jgi:hypothetical protein
MTMADGKVVLELLADIQKATSSISQFEAKWTQMMSKQQKELADSRKAGKDFTDGMVSGLESMVMKFASVAGITAIIMSAVEAQKRFSEEANRTSVAYDDIIRKALALQGIKGPEAGRARTEFANLDIALRADPGTAAQIFGQTGLRGGALKAAGMFQQFGGVADENFTRFLEGRNIPKTEQGINATMGMYKKILGPQFGSELGEFMGTAAVSEQLGIPLDEEARLMEMAKVSVGSRAPRNLRTVEQAMVQEFPGMSVDDIADRFKGANQRQLGELFGTPNAAWLGKAFQNWGGIQKGGGETPEQMGAAYVADWEGMTGGVGGAQREEVAVAARGQQENPLWGRQAAFYEYLSNVRKGHGLTDWGMGMGDYLHAGTLPSEQTRMEQAGGTTKELEGWRRIVETMGKAGKDMQEAAEKMKSKPVRD